MIAPTKGPWEGLKGRALFLGFTFMFMCVEGHGDGGRGSQPDLGLNPSSTLHFGHHPCPSKHPLSDPNKTVEIIGGTLVNLVQELNEIWIMEAPNKC